MVRILKNIVIGCLVGIILLLLMELYLRSAGIVERSFTDFKEEAGRVRPAEHQYITFNEGFGIGMFNKGRYLGPYISPAAKKNDFRIALLGDSYVESFQVFQRHKFSTVMQKTLEGEMGGKVAVMNFGRSGFDIEDMVVYGEVMVSDYSPDLLIYFLSNEDYTPRVSDVLVPRAEIAGDSLVVVRDFPEEYLNRYLSFHKIISRSNYLNMVSNVEKQVRAGLLYPKLFDKFYRPKKEVMNEGSGKEMKKRNVPLITYDLLEYLSSDTRTVIVDLAQEEILPEIKEVIDSLNIPYIALDHVLDSLEAVGNDPYFWKVTAKYGHWNHSAHREIGEYLAQKLQVYCPEPW